MALLSLAEGRFLRTRLAAVRHVTLDPGGPGVVRIHLVPCRRSWRNVPYIAILNGRDILPLDVSWAILLTCLIDALQPFEGQELQTGQWNAVVEQAVRETAAVYTRTLPEQIRADLFAVLEAFQAIAQGRSSALPVERMDLGSTEGCGETYLPIHSRLGQDSEGYPEVRYRGGGEHHPSSRSHRTEGAQE